jgi:hypothetical protein
MNVAWLGRPTHKNGLDNIGTQQPCVLIYSQLLPGITNVTDRAVYFGFYPWFIRAFEHRNPQASDAEFRLELRKADCLLTLIAHRHAVALDDSDDSAHGAACPGSQKLGPAASNLKPAETLKLSKFAIAADENSDRYFKNPLGGLGQYYLGVLRDEMSVLQGDIRTGVKYTNEVGAPLADSFAVGVDENLFFETLAADDLSVERLDQLASFCPCSVAKGLRQRAQEQLTRLVFGELIGQHGAERRNASLILILKFLRDRGGRSADDPIKSFLTCCYCGSLDGQEAWNLPTSMEQTRQFFGLYLRNEMLSLAFLALFKTALDTFDGQPKDIFDVRQAADWLLKQEPFAFRPDAPFDDLVPAYRANLPELFSFDAKHHEIVYWLDIVRRREGAVAAGVKLLTTLLARHGASRGLYVGIGIPADALSGYPLTLDTLATSVRRWAGLTEVGWMRALLVDVLSAHQRVAIRKLGQSGEDTLMFRVGEEGLFIDRRLDRIPETQPRIRQAFQIIRDLGLSSAGPDRTIPRLTERGQARLSELAE